MFKALPHKGKESIHMMPPLTNTKTVHVYTYTYIHIRYDLLIYTESDVYKEFKSSVSNVCLGRPDPCQIFKITM